jgi:predicted NAD-dependent protein-ADP-ribosyltransferase YbiA (DUF1768 family)
MTDKFVFFSGSADAKPGFGGTREKKNTSIEYSELAKIKNWRRMLSNFYVKPFVLDDNTWNSVEHFFHAVKFRSNYDFYITFTATSGSPWCEDPGKAKQAGKAGRVSERTKKIYHKKIGGIQIPKDVKMRDDFYKSNIPNKLQKLAFLAKFTQNKELKDMLLATKNAELWHYSGSRGKKPMICPEGQYWSKKTKQCESIPVCPKNTVFDDDTEKCVEPSSLGSEKDLILFHELMIVRDCIRKYDTIYDLKELSKFSSDIITELLE